MNDVFMTPVEASKLLRAYGDGAPNSQSIRVQAQEDPKKLGFPVSVIGSTVRIPRKPFYEFFGIEVKNDG